MQPLEKVFHDTKQLFITDGENYICVALDLTMPAPAPALCTYLGTLLGEVWNENEPSQRLGRAPTRGSRLKRIGFLIMCERACR